MLLGQLDQIINKSLSQNLSPLPFKVQGSSNGLIINHTFGQKSMVFISTVVMNDRISFDLNIIALDAKWKNFEHGKPVIRIPLVYSGILGKFNMEKVADITHVEIHMQQSYQVDSVFAVKISTTYKNSTKSKDTISLLILDPEEFKKTKIQSLHLLQLKCSDDHIYDFAWHPLSSLTLLVLTQNQSLEIWNLQDEDLIKPSHMLKLKNYKNSQQSLLSIKFTSFAILSQIPKPSPTSSSPSSVSSPQQKQLTQINHHRYSLFLMNSLGDIISVFPFLPPGAQLTREQYDLVYAKEREDSSREVKILSLYLNACELEYNDVDEQYVVSTMPTSQSHQRIQKWLTNTFNPKPPHLQKLSKQLHFSSLQLYQIDQKNILTIQLLHRTASACNCIKIGLINRQLRVGVENYFNRDQNDNVVYQVVEVRNQVGAGKGIDRGMDVRRVGSGGRVYQEVLGDSHNYYYTENNGLYKLDLSAIYKFLKTNDLKLLQPQSSFPTSLILQLPPNESILSLTSDRNINTIYLIRRSKTKIKLQTQSLTYLNTYSQVQQIVRSSTQLITKLNSIKSQYGYLGRNTVGAKIVELRVGGDQLRMYQEKGIEEFKKDYKRYCDNVKNSIDHGMSKLKTNYQAMKKRLRNFSDFKNRRNQINRLLEEVESNNERINKLLFEDKPSSKTQPKGQIAELAFNIDSLNKVFQTIKSKKLILKPENENSMQKQIENLFNRLKKVRVNLEEAKKIKREYENQTSF